MEISGEIDGNPKGIMKQNIKKHLDSMGIHALSLLRWAMGLANWLVTGDIIP